MATLVSSKGPVVEALPWPEGGCGPNSPALQALQLANGRRQKVVSHLGQAGSQTQALSSSGSGRGDQALQTVKCPVSLSPSGAQSEQLHKQP